MTLLSICQRVFGETGWPVLTTIATNSDPTAVQIKSLAISELEALSEKYDWPHLETEYTFATVNGQSVYPWPSNYRKLSVGSIFDRDEYYQIKGSIPVDQWNLRKYGLLSSISRRRFRVRYVGGTPGIEITPTPDAVKNVVAVYYSKEFALSETNASKEVYTADTDVSKIPERLVRLGLKWRFREAKGLDFGAALAEYNATISMIFGAAQASGDIPIGGNLTGYDELPAGYVPENGFG